MRLALLDVMNIVQLAIMLGPLLGAAAGYLVDGETGATSGFVIPIGPRRLIPKPCWRLRMESWLRSLTQTNLRSSTRGCGGSPFSFRFSMCTQIARRLTDVSFIVSAMKDFVSMREIPIARQKTNR